MNMGNCIAIVRRQAFGPSGPLVGIAWQFWNKNYYPEDAMKLPEHKCGLTLEHNDCRNVYMTVRKMIEEWQDTTMEDLYQWESDEHKQRAIDTNEIWTLQWYPDNPVGFFAIAAPTLDELLAYAETLK